MSSVPQAGLLTYSLGNIMTIKTTPRHMQGKARSVVLRPRRRMTIDVPRRENPKEIVLVTCCIRYKKTKNIHTQIRVPRMHESTRVDEGRKCSSLHAVSVGKGTGVPAM